MPHGVNATALALIPKKLDARTMRDYRPIACCNTLYKIISKIIANRLKKLLPDLIKPNQSAFIQGRLLLENVLLATEIVKDYHKDSISPRAALKIDITKAFDKGCISTAAFSINVNGGTIDKINRIPPPKPDEGKDRALWKQGPDLYQEKFVSKLTWDLLRSTKDKVVWFNIVWFPQAIPCQDFITWLACRNRLDTGYRMRQWGHTQICLFCREPNETRDHLFFACPYTYTAWTMLLSRLLGSRINPDWTRTIACS
ncbi:hypothetical protein Bca4012_084642 [Brassica carinata]